MCLALPETGGDFAALAANAGEEADQEKDGGSKRQCDAHHEGVVLRKLHVPLREIL